MAHKMCTKDTKNDHMTLTIKVRGLFLSHVFDSVISSHRHMTTVSKYLYNTTILIYMHYVDACNIMGQILS